jgi:hypothetical protein
MPRARSGSRARTRGLPPRGSRRDRVYAATTLSNTIASSVPGARVESFTLHPPRLDAVGVTAIEPAALPLMAAGG